MKGNERSKKLQEIHYGIINLINGVSYDVWIEGIASFFAFLDNSEGKARQDIENIWRFTEIISEYWYKKPYDNPWDISEKVWKEYKKRLKESTSLCKNQITNKKK